MKVVIDIDNDDLDRHLLLLLIAFRRRALPIDQGMLLFFQFLAAARLDTHLDLSVFQLNRYIVARHNRVLFTAFLLFLLILFIILLLFLARVLH